MRVKLVTAIAAHSNNDYNFIRFFYLPCLPHMYVCKYVRKAQCVAIIVLMKSKYFHYREKRKMSEYMQNMCNAL